MEHSFGQQLEKYICNILGFFTKETLQLNVCEETVRKAVIKLGYRVKKKIIHASERERSRCEGKTYTVEKTRKDTAG